MLRQFTKNYDRLNFDNFLIIQSTQSDARDLWKMQWLWKWR